MAAWAAIALGAIPDGVTVKLDELSALPLGVSTVMAPLPIELATGKMICWLVKDVGVTTCAPTDTSVCPGTGRKFCPVTVTVEPAVTMVGLKPAITGGGPDASTVKGPGLLADAVPTVTVTMPVVAPAGTVTVRSVAVADETVAVVPLN